MAPALARLNAEDDSVRRLILEALEIIRSDDFDRYFDLFTPDAVWMMPNSFGDVGVEEAKTFYRFNKKFRFEQQITVDEIMMAQDIAVIRLSFDGYLVAKQDKTAAPLRSVSRHIWVLQKQSDSQWKIARDIWNNPRETSRS